jgi:hypothetical protein
LGAKIEIKNMNSISGVRRALAYEVERQTAALASGGTLHQETRRWDDDAGQTFVMRTKEMAHDYRYFPDPDLLPLKSEGLLLEIRGRVPELPAAKRARFIEQYQISPYDASVLASDLDLAATERRRKGSKPKMAQLDPNDLQNALAIIGSTITDCRCHRQLSTNCSISSTPGRSPPKGRSSRRNVDREKSAAATLGKKVSAVRATPNPQGLRPSRTALPNPSRTSGRATLPLSTSSRAR